MYSSPYRKEWYVGTSIAREFIGMPTGSRIPTITDYTSAFECSRGIVQNALNELEERHAVTLDKQGKRGTYLLGKDEEQLFRLSGLTHLTASMPPPMDMHFAGLATGICSGMSQCRLPFAFAFVQGSGNRVQALLSGAYDFVVISQYAAQCYVGQYPQLQIAFPFTECEYSRPYKLYINQPGKQQLEDGMTIAIDPTSWDHVAITKKICEGRDIHIMEMPFISGLYAFYTKKIDCIVFREGMSIGNDNLLTQTLKKESMVSTDQISEIPLKEAAREMQLPVALINRDNYGIAGILKKYLSGEAVGAIQKQVLSGKMVPQFY